jgi:HPt (histidine-containing phosphotransfer) domain-containing protein
VQNNPSEYRIIIDYSAINNLNSILDPQQVNELIKDCCEEVIKRLEQIEALSQKVEFSEVLDRIKPIAHDLKGVSGNFGLTSLSDVACTLQNLTTPPYAKDPQLIKDTIQTLISVGNQSLEIIAPEKSKIL